MWSLLNLSLTYDICLMENRYMKILNLLILLVPGLLFASTGNVTLLRGQATFEGQPLKQGQDLTGKGTIRVAKKSYLKLHYNLAGHDVVFGADSEAEIDFAEPKGDESVTLVQGISRWVSGKITKPSSKAGIKTKNAIMGLRGTDFLVMSRPLLGETEVICFDGGVTLTNAMNKVDSKSISAGQWGGLGGRFGQKTSEILNLPPQFLIEVSSNLPIE